jgi:hypothetical protein
MWSFLLKLINPLGAIGKSLSEAYAAKLRAANDSERIEAEVTIAQLEARQAVLIAEQGSWMTRWVRPAIAFPIVFFLNKVIIYDICLGLGTTPQPSQELWWVITAVVTAYMLTRPFEKRK